MALLGVVVSVAVALLGGCGESSVEPELGGRGDAERLRSQRLEDRIAKLERRLAARRAARRQRDSHVSAGSSATPALRDFDRLAASLDGEVGLTVGLPGRSGPTELGTLTSGSAWSTIKVALAARVILDRGGPGQLSPTERSLIERAITASDNAAADQLWASLVTRHGGVEGAARAVTDILRRAGDPDTAVSTEGRDGFSPYGQTEWALDAQHRFVAALAGGCLGASAGGDYLLGLMGRVIPDQAWGLGSTGLPAQFKGGWGPSLDGRYLVRQMGVIETDSGSLVVTLAGSPEDGSFASGTAMLDRVAAWVVDRAPALASESSGC
jgi:hypothetical protein